MKTAYVQNLLFALLSSFACSATAQDGPKQDFKKIFQLISAKNAFSTSFREHIRSEAASLEDRRATLAARWESEKALGTQIVEARRVIEAGEGEGRDVQALAGELRALQGESPIVPVQVDGHVVAEIVAGWTGIPLGKMVKDEIRTVLNLKPMLEGRVILIVSGYIIAANFVDDVDDKFNIKDTVGNWAR